MNKSDFRKSCLSRLKKFSNFTKYKKDKVISQKIFNLIEDLKVKTVLLYIPMDIEVDVKPLIIKLRKRGIKVFVPYIKNDHFVPVLYRLPLVESVFGIRQPNFSTLYHDIELAVVPVVGIDGLYKRIGFGKGMYDRFFSKLTKKPLIVFVQRELCKTDKILSQNHDIQADVVIAF
ncbi:5-formyltetrahydrofolate cyclo-ligase [Arcobacter sp. FWKO B]|uniref:5-formyltetrahydrofolate cyclo-ligase n=1 Tax=Arcobacter sp. FWKO B TaxID=2593672 RepID=UPI0018A3ACF8|nr:5-formyltetrahydrofolate cyclo-ligase [Arcobacter sp. FWKO B]QOG11434.1 5-formyltetrahydrofolate cyclo-ligase [Arcobacter sp. FWKO B]